LFNQLVTHYGSWISLSTPFISAQQLFECTVFCPDDYYKNDDGLIIQKMGLQSKQVMTLTVPEI
jgi:hypothetical protein